MTRSAGAARAARALESTSERGAGSVLAVALVAAMLCVTMMLVPLYLLFAKKQALAGAADAAALAAADVRVGLLPGEPCAAAARVAAANGGTLSACSVDGLVVTVRVSATVAGFAVSVAATAGPATSPAALPTSPVALPTSAAALPDIRGSTGVE